MSKQAQVEYTRRVEALAETEGERGLVASLVLKPEGTRECTVDEMDFADPFWRRAYKVLMRLGAHGSAIDLAVMRTELGVKNESDLMKLATTMQDIVSDVAGYEKRVKRAARRRRALPHVRETYERLGSLATADADLIELTEKVQAELVAESTLRPPESSAEMVDAYDEWLMSDRSDELRFGYPNSKLARVGLMPGSLVTFMASPGVGKSLFAQNMVFNVLKQKPNEAVLYCSLEMQRELFMERQYQIYFGLKDSEVRTKARADSGPGLDRASYMKATQNLKALFDPEITTAQISNTLENRAVSNPISLVVIDFMDCVESESSKDNEAAKIRRMYKELKGIAKKFECVVLVLAQVKQDFGGDGDKRFGLRAARGSDGAEVFSDFVLGAWRPEKKPEISKDELVKVDGHFWVAVLKGRRCPTLEANLRLTRDTLQLDDWPRDAGA